MAHGFINKGRQTTFASKKEIAWHGLGKVVDVMTSKEAMTLGGLDFEVEKMAVYFTNQNTISFEEAKEKGLSERFIRNLFTEIHIESIKLQSNIMNEEN